MSQDTIWPAEPHTLAKHEILRRYLQAWFPIIDRAFGKQIYIDGFCGSGIYTGGEPGSPIIALTEAVKHKAEMRGSFEFVFSDTRPDRIEVLAEQLADIHVPNNISVLTKNCSFEDNLESILNALTFNSQPPTFAFIDPFGFKGIPYDLIARFMERPSCECLITFMADSINRFLEHPEDEIRKHISNAYGVESAVDIALSGTPDRIGALRDLYSEQLAEIAEFIRHFEMRDGNNRIIYYLFFISNHRLGFVKMKESMWKLDETGGFRFSDATIPEQAVLFDDEAQWKTRIGTLIHDKYQGRKGVSAGEMGKFIEERTAFLKKHMKTALKHLEERQAVSVHDTKANGRPRRKGTFPDRVIIDFK